MANWINPLIRIFSRMAINRSANSVIREFNGKPKRGRKNKGANTTVETEKDNSKLFLKIAVLVLSIVVFILLIKK